MFGKLALLFISIPLIELYLLIKAGEVFGALHTIALVVVTAVVGAYFARLEGLRTLHRIQDQLANGQMPAEEFVDSILIFVAGALLLTPGFLTDAVGFWLLIPVTRAQVKRGLRRRFEHYLHKRGTPIQMDI